MRLAIIALAACAPSISPYLAGTTIAVDGLIMCDVEQTYAESNGGAWDRPGQTPHTTLREMNPIIGPTPSPGALTVYAAADLVANTAIAFSRLPRWARWGWLAAVGAGETYIVVNHVSYAGWCGERR